MVNLRDRLKELDPNLHDALERSWHIAHEQWLPALGSKGSYNSYPHLRNLESHLNRLVDGYETVAGAKKKLDLAPVEIYLILAAILFHDIGRIVSENRHGWESRELLKKNAGDLGVHSSELAECLGRICEYHNSKDQNLKSELNNIVIDPYGEVRQLSLASLLKLVDYVDSAFSRVVPDYLFEGFAGRDPIGAFRRVISGVYVDHRSRMIRTVLRDSLSFSEDEDEDGVKRTDTRVVYRLNMDRPDSSVVMKNALECFLSKQPVAFQTFVTSLYEQTGYRSETSTSRLTRDRVSIFDAVAHASRLPRAEDPNGWSTGVGPIEMAVARQVVFAGRPQSTSRPGPWPPGLLVSIVLGNLRENGEALKSIQNDLAAFGMPIDAWVLDHREHLYNEFGEETYEPILDQEFLCSVADELYRLSTIPGKSECEYIDLAARLHESDNLPKVTIAVKRLSILTSDIPVEGGKKIKGRQETINAIRCGNGFCNWNVEPKGEGCEFVPLECVRQKIKLTGRPLHA